MEEDKEEDIIKEDTHIRGKQLALVSKAGLCKSYQICLSTNVSVTLFAQNVPDAQQGR